MSDLKRATISDVAQHAGVSRAAVSKVLRGAYGVSGTMKARVEASVDALGYRPSALARGMRGSSFTLGVFVVDLKNTFMSVLIDGIRAEADSHGYQVFIGQAERGLAQQQAMVEAMTDRKMDGLLLIAPFGSLEDLEAIGRTTPTVVLGRQGPGKSYDTVASDDLLGSGLIVDHLVALGHRHIAHLMHVGKEMNQPDMPQEVRAQGYKEAMIRNGLEKEIDVIETRWSYEGGQAAGEEMLAREALPTAVHAGTDMTAFGVMTALSAAGVSVPKEFSVVGYDNILASSLPSIALTSVDQSGFEMGSLAARLVVERIQGRQDAVTTIVSPTLVVRESTAQPRASGLSLD
ncbi:LacI family DNA-binding transcriptional regulator [Pseudarthrobacter sp. SL88]|uniref:LacI family DNA-binding transcriptional regulator n=1 Tax=Pseudarthrobacter sp. SL88 TaxID=2994666 RepID=UPI0022745DF4|nr:LacI family DNA-binding transcriptional regulator [Pseudarthrobacter sp. SL88]MCY1674981.1 LacI family DNA-binding transcriptional regulator [Pseudarthrobacter sp. SL88]